MVGGRGRSPFEYVLFYVSSFNQPLLFSSATLAPSSQPQPPALNYLLENLQTPESGVWGGMEARSLTGSVLEGFIEELLGGGADGH